MGSEDGAGALIALHAVLFKSCDVAGVGVGESSQHHPHIVAPCTSHLEQSVSQSFSQLHLFQPPTADEMADSDRQNRQSKGLASTLELGKITSCWSQLCMPLQEAMLSHVASNLAVLCHVICCAVYKVDMLEAYIRQAARSNRHVW